MYIDVTCRCGNQLHVKREHSGKRAKCPRCGNVVAIPNKTSASQHGNDEYNLASEEAGPSQRPSQRKCPSCGKALQRVAVICTDCGLDLRTGKKITEPASHPADVRPPLDSTDLQSGRTTATKRALWWAQTAGIVIALAAIIYLIFGVRATADLLGVGGERLRLASDNDYGVIVKLDGGKLRIFCPEGLCEKLFVSRGAGAVVTLNDGSYKLEVTDFGKAAPKASFFEFGFKAMRQRRVELDLSGFVGSDKMRFDVAARAPENVDIWVQDEGDEGGIKLLLMGHKFGTVITSFDEPFTIADLGGGQDLLCGDPEHKCILTALGRFTRGTNDSMP